MSLDRAIEHGKERRRPYHGAEAVDQCCRPHGGCPWCRNNRLHGEKVRLLDAEEQKREARTEETKDEEDRSQG